MFVPLKAGKEASSSEENILMNAFANVMVGERHISTDGRYHELRMVVGGMCLKERPQEEVPVIGTSARLATQPFVAGSQKS